MASLASKLLQPLTQIVFVALAIRSLGVERYGLWMTVAAGFAFGGLASLGVAPATVNRLSETLARKDFPHARVHFSNAFVFLTGTAVALGTVLSLVLPTVHATTRLNVPPMLEGEAWEAVAVYGSIWLVQFPLSLVPSVLTATQEAHLIYYWQIGAQCAGLGGLALAHSLGMGLSGTIAAYNGSLTAVSLASLAWLVVVRHPYLRPSATDISASALRSLVAPGLQFWLIGLSSLVSSQFITIVLAARVSVAAVSELDVAQKLVAMAIGFWAMFSQPLWGAYADAAARHDWSWIWRTHQMLQRTTIVIGGIVFSALAVLGPLLASAWSGHSIRPSPALMALLALQGLVQVLVMVDSTVLLGANRVGPQATAAALGAVFVVGVGPPLLARAGVVGAGAVLALVQVSTLVIVAIALQRLRNERQ